MKLRTKLTLDKYAAATFVLLLGLLRRTKILFSGKETINPGQMKLIVVCKFLGMGSIIQSTPLMLTLKRNYPDAKIVFLTTCKNQELIELFHFVNNTICIDDRNFYSLFISTIKWSVKFIKNKPDLFIDLEVHSYFSTIITALSFSKIKLGYFTEQEFAKNFNYSEMIYYNSNVAVHQVYLQSARLIGCNKLITELYDFNSIDVDISNSLHNKLNCLGCSLSEDYIIINPNASDLRKERRWGSGNYAGLINKILDNNLAAKVILIGGEDEVKYVNEVLENTEKKISSRVINTSGRLTLAELIFLIKNSSLLITNDSGPMHIAFSLKVKTLALFGPCSPQQYLNQYNVKFIYANVYCSPCVHHFMLSPCNGDNQCMKILKLIDVLEAVKMLTTNEGGRISENNFDDILFNTPGGKQTLGVLKKPG